MTWEEYRNNDMREQEQLDAARCVLEDATRDTVLWLQANPSAEERTQVLAMQGRLADLARIIERRMERRKEPRDDWQWSEGVREVLSRLLKAREARGGVVGESWNRLAKRLPRELPGSKPKPKLPAPVKTVNTSGGIRLSPASSHSSAGGLKSLDYPPEFAPEARDRIEREKIRASRELLPASVYEFEDQELAIRCIMRIFLAFAKKVCALRKERGWTLDRVQREGEEFLRRLTITVVFAKFPGLDRHWINNLNGSILSDVERRFKASREWQQYEELLLESPLESSGQTDTARKSAPTLQAESSRVQNNGKTTQSAESKSTSAERQTQARPIDRGKFCDGVIDEIKRIKNLAVGTGRSVAEIEKENPDFAVWKVRTSLSHEDQETFNHPNRWGPSVGYAKIVLSKTHDVSTHTIDSWVKAYRKDRQAKKA